MTGRIKKYQRKILAISISCIIGWTLTYLMAKVLGNYDGFLFISLPIILGALPVIIHGYKKDVSKPSLRFTAFTTLFIYFIGLFSLAIEGMICLVMVTPIAIFLTWVGYLLGYQVIKKQHTSTTSAAIIILIISIPAVMSFGDPEDDDLRSVTTTIEINATRDIVWENVVAFPQLAEPNELIFKAGIAYPTKAKIYGQGVGAIRYCEFSTGTFIEPITTWDAPNVLGFGVTAQPEPMKEISPYNIHPKHLKGYWITKHGEFKLTELPNGHTLIQGTTWYINKFKPEFYWTIWSDYIVHTIHKRVLRHIKNESERLMNSKRQ